VLSC